MIEGIRMNSGMNRMKGQAFGVGVGPGDPELMTLKAVRILQEADAIACPGKTLEESTAFKIAVKNVPGITKKELISISVPMTYDRLQQGSEHLESSRRIMKCLDEGKNVAFIVLGDPTIYSSFSYYQKILEKEGYHTEIISGVPSFCAVAAKLNIPLIEWNEQMHVIPLAHQDNLGERYPGTRVYMKAGKKLKELKEHLGQEETYTVENCGLEGERVTCGIPDQSDYYTTVIVKD